RSFSSQCYLAECVHETNVRARAIKGSSNERDVLLRLQPRQCPGSDDQGHRQKPPVFWSESSSARERIPSFLLVLTGLRESILHPPETGCAGKLAEDRCQCLTCALAFARAPT